MRPLTPRVALGQVVLAVASALVVMEGIAPLEWLPQHGQRLGPRLLLAGAVAGLPAVILLLQQNRSNDEW